VQGAAWIAAFGEIKAETADDVDGGTFSARTLVVDCGLVDSRPGIKRTASSREIENDIPPPHNFREAMCDILAAAAMVRVFSRCGIIVPVVTASNHVVTSFFEEDLVAKKFDGNKNPGWTSGMTLPNKNPRKIQS